MSKFCAFVQLVFVAGRRYALLLGIWFLIATILGYSLFAAATPYNVLAAKNATLTYSSYLGGNSVDVGKAITVDHAGNIYVMGETSSNNFLGSGVTIKGYSDIFIAKFDPSGQTLLDLFIIGSGATDTALAIEVDKQGNIYGTVNTYANDFPTHNALWSAWPAFYHNGTLFKLNPSGQLIYSTYLPLDVFGLHDNLAVDSAGNAYIVGSDFVGELSNQISLLKINPTGSTLLLEKHVGGPSTEKGTAIALDSSGRIYLAGIISSGVGFPVTANAHQTKCGDLIYGSTTYCYEDGLVVVLNAAGEVTYSSYHGGSFADKPIAIDTDGQGNILIAGDTGSGRFPVVQALQDSCPLHVEQDKCETLRGFVSLLNINGAKGKLTYSTYLGDPTKESINSVTAAALDSTGRATVLGYTNGRQFPLANPLQDKLSESFCNQTYCADMFIVTFGPAGGLSFGSYLGASYDDYPYGIALNNLGSLYITGLTEAFNFPVTNNAFQPQDLPYDDGFVVKIAVNAAPPPTMTPTSTITPIPPAGDNYVYFPMLIR